MKPIFLMIVVTGIIIIPLGAAQVETPASNNRGILYFDPTEHDFGNMQGGETAETIFYIWMGGGCCELTYSLSWTADWITVFPTSGVSYGEQDEISVSIDTAGLEIGYYIELVHIDSDGGTGDFMVMVNIYDTPDATLQFEPESYDFGDSFQGKQYETTFRLWNSGTEPLFFDITWDEVCISVYPTSGVSNGEQKVISVSIDLADVSVGTLIEEINIETNNNSGVFTLYANVVALPDLSFSAFKTDVFSLKTSLRNKGDVDAPNVEWSILLEGGSILFGYETMGSLVELSGGESIDLQTSFIFGFGKTRIYAQVTIDDDIIDKREQDATVFLSFIMVKPGGG